MNISIYQKYARRAGNKSILKQFYCAKIVDDVYDELRFMLSRFGEEIEFGFAHPAPCTAWRSERIMHKYDEEGLGRFAYRVHLFENVSAYDVPDKGGETVNQKAIACEMTGDEELLTEFQSIRDSAGRYLGFVSLRPREYEKPEHFHFQYCLVATLAPPPFMLRPRYHLITCIAGAADGALPFRATPFCIPESFTQSAGERRGNAFPCIHAALHSALLLKANNFGFRPLTGQDMITLLWEMHAKTLEGRTMQDLNEKGITLRDALEIVRHEQTQAGGVLEVITEGKKASAGERTIEAMSREAHLTLTEYLTNGLPVILEVNQMNKKEETSHAVLLIGFHLMTDPDETHWPVPAEKAPEFSQMEMRELPGRFVVHDTHFGPYREIAAKILLDAALIRENGKSSAIRYLPILPYGSRIGVRDVRYATKKRLAGHSVDLLETYLREELEGDESHLPLLEPEQARLVVRLLPAYRVRRRYFGFEPDSDPPITKDALTQKLRDAMRKAATAQEAEASQEPLWWWCVEVRTSQQVKERSESGWPRQETNFKTLPAIVYIWPTTADPDALKGDKPPPVCIAYVGKSRAIIEADGEMWTAKWSHWAA